MNGLVSQYLMHGGVSRPAGLAVSDGEVKYRFLSLLNQIMRLNVGMYCAGYRPEWAGSLYVKGSKHY